MLNTELQTYVQTILADEVPEERQVVLQSVVDFIQQKRAAQSPILLNFICTHNSRRSHLGQVWAALAAYYYGVSGVLTFSGGTDSTACNPRTIAALQRAGWEAIALSEGTNPVYALRYTNHAPACICFSKTWGHPMNPQGDFAAIMTCSDADENCPYIPGATRLSVRYVDPKRFDDTPEEAAGYDTRCRQIAREMLWVFEQVTKA
jgi:arsenate reductase (thioredoxin)